MAGPIAPLTSSTTARSAAPACGGKASIVRAIPARMRTAHQCGWVLEREPALIDRGCIGRLLCKRGESRGDCYLVMAGLVPAIPILAAPCQRDRDRGDKPGDDESAATSFAPLTSIRRRPVRRRMRHMHRHQDDWRAAGRDDLVRRARRHDEHIALDDSLSVAACDR